MNYFLESYATEYVFNVMDSEILLFTQLSNMTPTEYAEALWNYEVFCNLVYNEYVVQGMFFEGFHRSI